MNLIRISILLFAVALFLSVTGYGANPSDPLRLAFWYEGWTAKTWDLLQPANTIIGVPPTAVEEIHQHKGRAIAYVTFYQAVIGSQFLSTESDLKNVGFGTPDGFLKSAFGGKDNFVLCSNSRELRRRIESQLEVLFAKEHYDGLFIDNAYLPPATTMHCTADHSHVDRNWSGGEAYIDLIGSVYTDLKKKNPNILIVINPGNPQAADQLRLSGHSLWDFADYLLWESYGYSSLIGSAHDRWSSIIPQSRNIGANPHASKILALSYPRDLPEAYYSFALAKAFGFQYAANLGNREERRLDNEGGHFGVFLSELPLAVGAPTSEPKDTNGVIIREYQNAVVFANPGAVLAVVQAPHSGTLWTAEGHRDIKANTPLSVPSHSGSILLLKR